MNRLAYERARESLQRGHQVMVFVHARKDTVRTAQVKGREGGGEGVRYMVKFNSQAGQSPVVHKMNLLAPWSKSNMKSVIRYSARHRSVLFAMLLP